MRRSGAARRGAAVVHVRAAAHDIPVERFEKAIDERTKLVSIAGVCYRNGARIDVDSVVRIARLAFLYCKVELGVAETREHVNV